MGATPDLELLVAGGGPVGLATSIRARLAGLDVAIIEPRETPIDKACGEGLMPGALAALESLGVSVVGGDFGGIAYVQGDIRAEHRFARGVGRGVRRTTLHRALAERAAELGVGRLTGRVESIVQHSGSVSVSGAGIESVSARWLIGCDGLHSSVRGLAGLEASPAARVHRRFGLRQHFHVAPFSDLVEVHWTREVEAYLTPLGPELLGVALLGPPGIDYRSMLAALPGVGEALANAQTDGPVRGAGPLRQRTRARTAGRVLLAGDASGYVDALTGEGLRVGFAQADAAVRAVQTGDLRGYERDWVRATRDFRLITAGLVAAARSPLRSRIVPTSARLPRAFGAVVERLAR